jgi:hypothetical protein
MDSSGTYSILPVAWPVATRLTPPSVCFFNAELVNASPSQTNLLEGSYSLGPQNQWRLSIAILVWGMFRVGSFEFLNL